MTKKKYATFAGGCFWCMQPPFEKIAGVLSIVPGYSGKEESHPTYHNHSNHREAVQVTYDADKVKFDQLLDAFWQSIDPTDDGGQFADRGHSYTTAIFYENDEEKKIAEGSKKRLEESGKFDKPIVTKIEPFVGFTQAEDYHVDYHKKHPMQYKTYKYFSGRGPFLEKTWGKH